MSSTKLMTFEFIDRLNLLVSGARTVPLTNKIMADKEELLNLLKRLEDSIPDDVQQAKRLLDVEEQILAESRKEAEAKDAEYLRSRRPVWRRQGRCQYCGGFFKGGLKGVKVCSMCGMEKDY